MHGSNYVSHRIMLIVPAGFANLIHGARAWKINLVKFDFMSPSLIPVYSPLSLDTAPVDRDFTRVAALFELLQSILVVLPLPASFFPHHPPTTDLGNAGIGQPIGFTTVMSVGIPTGAASEQETPVSSASHALPKSSL
ncbi:hypothetical protein llap_22945 [Limosa lapponica baueri]|uniref:Uncharacterized protein n=1 Tax=Limosa lapponica baueri TaxID=1758121 RepID=A0A2I0SYY7_LIMLA|nr:hypothetical protein llap_22945 [Limosa lapponica baueri]